MSEPTSHIQPANLLTFPRGTSAYAFCTYFDRHYLTRGLALYESLRRHCARPFTLWILCFDDETYAVLSRLNLPSVRLIAQAEFEAGDDALAAVKTARSRVEYYWTCTPSLPLYVLAHNPEVNLITYLDADLYFYGDPAPIYDELSDGSILIVEHRYAPEYVSLAATSGIYNVGWMSFRRDVRGLACLSWWRERCLEWCYAHYEDGKFGDQKYLDDWPQRFAGVVVLQHKGAGLAPWNLSQYRLTWCNGRLAVDGQPLIFFHFHNFRCVHERAVEPTGGYELPRVAIKHLFLPYAARLLALSEDLGLPFPDAGRAITTRALLGSLFSRRLLLVRPAWLALLLWGWVDWRWRTERHLGKGFTAHQQGNLSEARRHLLRAIGRNPTVLRNLGIVSILIESVVGTPAMARYRMWRHGTARRPADKSA
ncbi:MAG: hypothetical protein NZP34_08510 [Caldilineales bacterium]|nr:hypothetical protein [Caldilineales bacterium]